MQIVLRKKVSLQKLPRGLETESYLWLLLLPSCRNLFLKK